MASGLTSSSATISKWLAGLSLPAHFNGSGGSVAAGGMNGPPPPEGGRSPHRPAGALGALLTTGLAAAWRVLTLPQALALRWLSLAAALAIRLLALLGAPPAGYVPQAKVSWPALLALSYSFLLCGASSWAVLWREARAQGGYGGGAGRPRARAAAQPCPDPFPSRPGGGALAP